MTTIFTIPTLDGVDTDFDEIHERIKQERPDSNLAVTPSSSLSGNSGSGNFGSGLRPSSGMPDDWEPEEIVTSNGNKIRINPDNTWTRVPLTPEERRQREIIRQQHQKSDDLRISGQSLYLNKQASKEFWQLLNSDRPFGWFATWWRNLRDHQTIYTPAGIQMVQDAATAVADHHLEYARHSVNLEAARNRLEIDDQDRTFQRYHSWQDGLAEIRVLDEGMRVQTLHQKDLEGFQSHLRREEAKQLAELEREKLAMEQLHAFKTNVMRLMTLGDESAKILAKSVIKSVSAIEEMVEEAGLDRRQQEALSPILMGKLAKVVDAVEAELARIGLDD